ncbi:MAG: GNAT family N-acetyltransferase [Gemmatimonadales bacterium]
MVNGSPAEGPLAEGKASSELRIRRAVSADAPMLARLRYDFRRELDPVEEPEDAFLQRCTAWMSDRLQPGGAWRCFVALLRDCMVGTVWLQDIEKLPNPVGHSELHGYVSSVYVVPESRGSGIGSALLQACLADADARGLDALFLWPSDRSRPLYHRHGFEAGDDLLQRRP